MPLFDELSNLRPLEDPEDRRAEELARGDKKYGKAHLRETSVSLQRFNFTLNLIRVLIALALLALVAFLIYQGIMLFIPKETETPRKAVQVILPWLWERGAS